MTKKSTSQDDSQEDTSEANKKNENNQNQKKPLGDEQQDEQEEEEEEEEEDEEEREQTIYEVRNYRLGGRGDMEYEIVWANSDPEDNDRSSSWESLPELKSYHEKQLLKNFHLIEAFDNSIHKRGRRTRQQQYQPEKIVERRVSENSTRKAASRKKTSKDHEEGSEDEMEVSSAAEATARKPSRKKTSQDHEDGEDEKDAAGVEDASSSPQRQKMKKKRKRGSTENSNVEDEHEQSHAKNRPRARRKVVTSDEDVIMVEDAPAVEHSPKGAANENEFDEEDDDIPLEMLVKPRKKKKSSAKSRRSSRRIHSDSEESFEFSDDEALSNNSKHASATTAMTASKVENTVLHGKKEEVSEHHEVHLDGWASLLDTETALPVPVAHVVEEIVVKPIAPTQPIVKAGVPSGIVFQVEMPGFELYSIQLTQKLGIIPSLFIGSSSTPLEAKYVPQSVRTFLLNSPMIQELYRFDVTDTSPKTNDMIRSLAHSLTGLMCKTCKSTDERLFLFPVKEANMSLSMIGAIYRWESIFPYAVQMYQESLDVRRKMHLVLDLDSTLIWALPSTQVEDSKKSRCCYNVKGSAYDMWVQFRPGVDQFLKEVSVNFEISVYTAAELEYAKELIRKAHDLQWRVKGSHETPHYDDGFKWHEAIPPSRIISSAKEGLSGTLNPNLKDLQNAYLFYQYPMMRNSVVIVDDNMNSWVEANRMHVYVIPPFTGDDHDKELGPCLDYLRSIWREFFVSRALNGR